MMNGTDDDDKMVSHLYGSTNAQAAVDGLRLARNIRRRKQASQDNHKVVLTYTSNLVSSGTREVIAFLIRTGLIDAVIATAGGVEEDVIKCLGSTVVGAFDLPGESLRKQGMNRVGNLLIPNDNYVHFESFFCPILREIHSRSVKAIVEDRPTVVTCPSEIIAAMGNALSDAVRSPKAGSVFTIDKRLAAHSVVLAAHDRRIPIFCPAFTDGSMGDMSFFYNISHPGLVIDPLRDFDGLVSLLGGAPTCAAICCGSGLPRHHFLLSAVSASTTVTEALLIDTAINGADSSESGSTVEDYRKRSMLPVDGQAVRVALDATIFLPLIAYSWSRE